MKKIMFTIFALMLSTAATANPKVKEYKDGIFTSQVGVINYVVDANTELCFAVETGTSYGSGLTSIPCENLAKRPEWKPYITWVN
jgi:hypothetical protein